MNVRRYVTQQFYLYDIRFISSRCCKWDEFSFLSSANVGVLKSAQKSRFVNHGKSKNQMWDVSHHKIIGARRLAYWSWLIVETKETKGYSNTTASYSLPRYFWPQKTEVKPEFSQKLDEVFPRSNRRYKLRFHRGSIAENAPILSSGTVQAYTARGKHWWEFFFYKMKPSKSETISADTSHTQMQLNAI